MHKNNTFKSNNGYFNSLKTPSLKHQDQMTIIQRRQCPFYSTLFWS